MFWRILKAVDQFNQEIEQRTSVGEALNGLKLQEKYNFLCFP